MAELAKDEIEKLTAEDMRDYMYGHIQAMVEGNTPDNVAFHYFMPAIPFGPELAAFMDIGPRAKALKEEGFTVNDMLRAAVNFASIVDYVPVLGEAGAEGEIVDINTLISSGTQVSKVYESILANCRVVDNERSEEDQEKLAKLRELLYNESIEDEDASDDDGADTDTDDGGFDDDDLLAGFGDDDDELDLGSIFDDGASVSDLVADPNAIASPTKAMRLYEALMSNYEQTVLTVADQLKAISPNDPNGGLRVQMLQKKIRAAERRWEAQGHKTKVENIIARIEQLSQGGMPAYVSDLRARLEGNKMVASIVADEEAGLSLLSESAYYTALRPNGILSAPSLMKVTLKSSDTSTWSKFKQKKTSASLKAPVIGIFGGGGGKVMKFSSDQESKFFKNDFEISFEIVQGVIDRPWLAKDFLECRAYTTVDPETGTPLDPVSQITQLSDGGVPPKAGMVPALPVTVYFIRNLTVKSSAFAQLSEVDRDQLTAKGGVSVFGFGAKAAHNSQTVETNYSTSSTTGEITANGTYLIGMSSVFLKQAPNPDFETFPKDKWI